MRLLRLEGEGLGGRAIDLHPEISVLTDMDDDLRDRLLRACQALPAAQDPGCAGLIEAHGVLFDLDPSALELLGLGEDLDVLVQPPTAAPAEEEGPSTADVLESAVAELRRCGGDLDRAQIDVLTQLEEERALLDPFARTAYEQEQANADRTVGLVDIEETLADLEEPAPIEERQREIERIEHDRDNVDLAVVVDALAVATADDQVDAEAIESGRLAVELRQIDTELADLDLVLESQGKHPIELARRRDALTVELARLESESAPRELDPDDSVALEVIHDRVVQAQGKVDGSLLGGGKAERRLVEAVEEELVVLERLSLPTYSAYIMSVTVGNSDPELDQQLHEARQELAACQSEFETATQMLEHDPARTTLSLRQDEIVARAAELVQRDPGPDVVGTLLGFKVNRDKEDPIDGLRHELERAGLIDPGLGLDSAELCDFAAAWVEEMEDAVERADRLAEEKAELAARLETIRSAQAAAADARQKADHVEPAVDLTTARERLAVHEAAAEKVAALTALLEDVDTRRHELDARLEAQQVLADLARAGTDRTESDGDGVPRAESIRQLLRARLENHRKRSFAGSVPMVVNAMFEGLDRDAVGDLLGDLEQAAAGIQVIILDDDVPVATWATTAGIERAAVISPE
jgi:hypothetical protein